MGPVVRGPEGSQYARSLLAFVWLLVLNGFPLSWHRTRGGLVYSWVGLEMSLRGWSLGISQPRADWVDKWLSTTIEARRVNTAELGEALGRLVCVYGALQYDRPFLASPPPLRLQGAPPGQALHASCRCTPWWFCVGFGIAFASAGRAPSGDGPPSTGPD